MRVQAWMSIIAKLDEAGCTIDAGSFCLEKFWFGAICEQLIQIELILPYLV
jgi:hypothetical protein